MNFPTHTATYEQKINGVELIMCENSREVHRLNFSSMEEMDKFLNSVTIERGNHDCGEKIATAP